MRVLIVQPWIRVGGAELLSLHLADELERMGHSAPIAALFVDEPGLPDALLARRFSLPPALLQGAFRRSRTLTVLLGPAVLFGVVLRASRDADVLNPHNLPGPVVSALVGRIRRLPVVWHVNEVPEPIRAGDLPAYGIVERVGWWLGSVLARWCARAPAALTVLSGSTRTAVRDRYGREAQVIRPGIGVRGGLRRSPGTRYVLFVGKLVPQKGPLEAVRVVAELVRRGHDIHLVIVGDGPLRRIVDAVAARELPGRARVRSHIDQEELRDLYGSAELVLVTADERQSWGLVPLEALACGTPSVIRQAIGAAEILGPARAALIVGATDATFVAAAERILRDPDLRATLVANGATIVSELTWRRFAEECAAVFRAARSATIG